MSREYRVEVLASILMEEKLPFHWKVVDAAAGLYHGRAYSVSATLLTDVGDVLDFLCGHEIDYGFGQGGKSHSRS